MVIPVRIGSAEMARLLGKFKPGSVVTADDLFRMYVRLAEKEDGAEIVATRNMLGRALSAAGCKRTVVRKARGKRGEQRVNDTYCWIIPGAPPRYPEDERMMETLRTVGPGIIPVETIESTYYQLATKHCWSFAMARPEIARWLTKHGFVKIKERYKKNEPPPPPARYISAAKIGVSSIRNPVPVDQTAWVDPDFAPEDEV